MGESQSTNCLIDSRQRVERRSRQPDGVLGVGSLLVLTVGVLLLVLRIAQQNYIMALGVVWVANGLTMILHALYWWRYGLSRRWKVAVVLQGLLTIAPLLLGEYGLILIFFMLGGALRFW